MKTVLRQEKKGLGMSPWPDNSTVNEKLDYLLAEIKAVEAIILQMRGDLALQIDILAELKDRVAGLENNKEKK